MKNYIVVSLGEFLKEVNNEEKYRTKVLKELKKFKCSRETDLENFLHKNAIIYEESNIGKTFLIMDEDLLDLGEWKILAFFTTGQSSINISNITKSKRKKLLGNIPGRDNLQHIPVLLIGQLGRDDNVNSHELPGEIILNEAYEVIRKAVMIIGGKLLILECREHMFSKFYQNQGFYKLNDSSDSSGLLTLYKKINFINSKA